MKPENIPNFSSPNSSQWKGLTLDELRYQMALNHARREIVGAQIHNLGQEVSEGRLIKSMQGGLLSRVLSSLNYIDYAVIAFNVFSKVRQLWPRHKK